MKYKHNMQTANDRIEEIRASVLFDREWYINKYPDVEKTGLEPEEHYVRYGAMLKRSPSAEFDTIFCLNTYTDIAESKKVPLLTYLESEDYRTRPTNYNHWANITASEKDKSIAEWQSDGALTSRSPRISYCIPIMGRLDDIKGTLRANLEENEEFKDKIEFIILEFGGDLAVYNWLNEEFPSEMASGYLRVLSDTSNLDSWHFGKAKNGFKQFIAGDIYSSLDGDNYVTREETKMLLDVADEYPNGFIFHHFSGHWGDGTSGRISMPAWVYRIVGYNPKLLPRQFDEMDVIIGALTRYPALPFIGINRQRNAFTLSVFCAEFLKTEKLPNKFVFKDDCRHVPPLNPRGEDYTNKTLYWRDMNNFNASFSALTHIKNDNRKDSYRGKLNFHKYRLIENIPNDQILTTLFHENNFEINRTIDNNSICLFACVHDEEHFLSKFVPHYRLLGVTHFFIIDDNSKKPVNELKLGDDVLSFSPKVGDFRTSKTLWIEGLMKAFLPKGSWALTVDADEFIQLPYPHSTLKSITDQLEVSGQDYATGLLIDMLPAPGLTAQSMEKSEHEYLNMFDHFCFKNTAPPHEYANQASVKWGFGRYNRISWRCDTRYHLFGTLDSLRKMPLFRYDVTRHLNQGFHTFHYLNKERDEGHSVWNNNPIIPIFHYKLVKLFSEESRRKMVSLSNGYHSRTGDNITKIFNNSSYDYMERFKSIENDLLNYSEARVFNKFCI